MFVILLLAWVFLPVYIASGVSQSVKFCVWSFFVLYKCYF